MDFQTRYEFDPKTDLLGRGGFSKVYKANDTLLERTVALKFFTATVADKYQVLNEIKKVIRLEHPNLCKYYDVAVLNSTNVLGETERIEVGIMEYIDAGDFRSFTIKNPEYTDKLLIDVLRGLAYLHKHGIVHRDLKPQNILVKWVDDEPVSKITDFGISKLISAEDNNSSALLGTIEYMAPEQFNPKKYGINGRIATNIDLWSFGLLVYEALCHKPFFGSRSSGISAEQVMTNILSDASLIKADTLPPKYKEIIKKCLVKDASQRVQNALELIPLFDDRLYTDEKPASTEMVEQVSQVGKQDTQLIEPVLSTTGDETQVIGLVPEKEDKEEPGIVDEETQFIPSVAPEETKVVETDPEETQVVSPVLEETRLIEESVPEETEVITPVDEETKVLQTAFEDEREGEILPEETQVLEPVSDDTEVIQSKEEDIQVIVNKEVDPDVNDKKFEKSLTGLERREEKDLPKRKPIKKLVLLSVLALILIIVIIAYPALNRSPKTTESPTAIQTPPSQRIEDEFILSLMPVQGGTFMMGDSNTRVANPALPAHEVTLNSFSIGQYEVTYDQFKKFIEETNYKTTAEQRDSSYIYANGDWLLKKGINWRHDVYGNSIDPNTKNIPVVHVSWNDANAFCAWLSNKKNEKYRLPTEAEWEFAARGGNNSGHYTFSGSDSINAVAWYKENSGDSLHPIGQKQPNELKLYDMSGNVSEWCYDLFDPAYYKTSVKDNPFGPDSLATKDNKRVLRGGAWGIEKEVCRTTYRAGFGADESGGNIGFRICKAIK